MILSLALLPALQPAHAGAGAQTPRALEIAAAPVVAAPAAGTDSLSATSAVTVSLPFATRAWPWPSFVGVEATAFFAPGSGLLARAEELGVRWARLNGRISWRTLQPTENAPIDWSKLAAFDDELRALRAAGIRPLVIVDDNPYWATIPNARKDGKPTSCAAIRPDKFGNYAQFMQQLVSRYKAPEFNVRDWELGNEVDVDPNLVIPDEVFGCWGDIADPYYGGRRYGDMLKAVSPAIRAANPNARIWMGGLLLDRPNTTDPNKGKPERFLEGVLIAGGAPHFDVLPYHGYLNYDASGKYDQDWIARIQEGWHGLGGVTIGKARFLREVMSRYNVNKPLFLNETGFVCPNDAYETQPYCVPQPVPSFFEQQANHIVRIAVRALSVDVGGIMWYTIDGPGWRNGALLDPSGNPRTVFNTYKHLANILKGTRFVGKADYGNAIEAYRFSDGSREVQVMWVHPGTAVASVPQSRFAAAYNRDGAPITPTPSGANSTFTVGFEPIFIVLNP
jgi:hypothetical protein